MQEIPILLFANKVDMEEKLVVSVEELTELAKELGLIGPFLMSAKTGNGVKEGFQECAEKIFESNRDDAYGQQWKQTEVVFGGHSLDKDPEKKGGCCN